MRTYFDSLSIAMSQNSEYDLRLLLRIVAIQKRSKQNLAYKGYYLFSLLFFESQCGSV
jgi:hypothetical protein